MAGSKNRSKLKLKANNQALRLPADRTSTKLYGVSEQSIVEDIKLRSLELIEFFRPYADLVLRIAKRNLYAALTVAFLWTVYLLAIVCRSYTIVNLIDDLSDFIYTQCHLAVSFWCLNNILVIGDTAKQRILEYQQRKINEIRDMVMKEERAKQAAMRKVHRKEIARMVWEQKTMLHIIANLDEHLQEVDRQGSNIDVERALVFIEKRYVVEETVELDAAVILGLEEG